MLDVLVIAKAITENARRTVEIIHFWIISKITNFHRKQR
jgi:hypothetical protein